MKRIVSLLLGAAMLLPTLAINAPLAGGNPPDEATQKGSMTVIASPDLYNLATAWASRFTEVNPKVNIKVMNLSETGSQGSLPGGTDLLFVSSGYKQADPESKWSMAVGRDAIVPVYNSSSVFASEIIRQGVSAEELTRIITDPQKSTWSNLLDGGQNVPVHFYFTGDESINKTLAGFLHIDSEAIKGTPVANGTELIAALQKDPDGIGFCKLTDLTGSGQNELNGIGLLPIDKNANGKIDYIEKIYGNVADLTRGIWIGKYPVELCRNIYAVASEKPITENEVAFLRYVLTDGQQNLVTEGLNSLSNPERLSKIDRLPVGLLKASTSKGLNIIQLLITLAAALVIILSIVITILRQRRNAGHPAENLDSVHLQAVNANSVTVPKGIYFDKTHTWAFMEKNGIVKIGIDDFLQHVTGQISSIKMKGPGDKVKKGESILTLIQKGKRLVISAPVSGIIRAENSILFTDSSLINTSPYSEGWIYQIEPTNWVREIQFLFMADKYTEWLKSEFTRLRDFLAVTIKPGEPEYAYVVLQDGGEISDHVMENLGPEVWEEFQTQFIDSSK
ncbi:MAG: substrate-binding domain-containing protein [Bacteroidales bacterium]